MADPRWKELRLTKVLPVIFILVLIFSLIAIYSSLHLLPQIRSKIGTVQNDGYIQGGFFLALTVLLLLSYARAVLTHPGEVPEVSSEGIEWIVKKYSPETDPELVDRDGEPFLQESKRNGARRRCKYCAEAKKVAVQYKPDRCHHCKLCEMCILKMDHHCPWIYNCVGFKNHKYFMLTVLYSVLDTNLIFFSMWPTVEKSVDKDTETLVRFWLVFGQTIAALLGSVVSLFFYFHMWLMMKGMTTIEFCEKQRSRGYNVSIYNRGWVGNVEAVLGSSPLLWFLPCNPPLGDGLSFAQEATETTPLGQERRGSSRSRGSKSGPLGGSWRPTSSEQMA